MSISRRREAPSVIQVRVTRRRGTQGGKWYKVIREMVQKGMNGNTPRADTDDRHCIALQCVGPGLDCTRTRSRPFLSSLRPVVCEKPSNVAALDLEPRASFADSLLKCRSWMSCRLLVLCLDVPWPKEVLGVESRGPDGEGPCTRRRGREPTPTRFGAGESHGGVE